MTRAALLPAGADPFLNAYWLRHYRTWADQVDELHVAVCGDIPAEVIRYTAECIKSVPHATMHYFPERTKHGQKARPRGSSPNFRRATPISDSEA